MKRSSESGAEATTFVKKNQARSNDINHANTYSVMKLSLNLLISTRKKVSVVKENR